MPVLQVNGPISRVAVPALSRLQDRAEEYRAYYQKAVTLMVACGMPMVAFMFVAADEVILLILGPQWTEAAPLFRVLAPAAFVATFNVATGWVYVSLGRSDRQFQWQILASAVRVSAYVIGLRWGAMGVAAAVSVSVCGLRLPGVLYCFKGTPLKASDLGSALWRPALASAAAAGLAFAVRSLAFGGAGAALSIGVELAVFGPAYLAIWAVLPGGRERLADLLQLVRELRYNSNSRS